MPEYGKTWGNGSNTYDYNIFDIDRQIELEKYTDFEFSTTDKTIGTVEGVKKEAVKDIEKVKETFSNVGNSFAIGGRTLIILLGLSLVLTVFKKVRFA